MMDTADPEDFTAASRALLYGGNEEPPIEQPPVVDEPIASSKKPMNLWVILVLGIIGIVLGGLGIVIWQQLAPNGLRSPNEPPQSPLPESAPSPSQQLPSPSTDLN